MHELDYEMCVYWSDADNGYLVEVPELPGCMADGTTPEEAVTNAKTRIAEWVAFARELGREIPAPKRAAWAFQYVGSGAYQAEILEMRPIALLYRPLNANDIHLRKSS
jgi:predicted RNase H-like HicB family nuclease